MTRNAPGGAHRAGVWARWAHAVQARPLGKTILAVLVMAAVSPPAFSLHLGSSDAANDPETTTRQAYTSMA
ncbi:MULTISPECIES: hypothetical protein [Streptomyces violaceusniger group]|uniref:Uncharacterized protein n=2 Tax=Streptomyces rhizosphaericus TaxID=114699 RepID=A0ABN1R4T1_9ACTN|nr:MULTISPECIES: hypothetical protein [Streptomyces violaceusniger group]